MQKPSFFNLPTRLLRFFNSFFKAEAPQEQVPAQTVFALEEVIERGGENGFSFAFRKKDRSVRYAEGTGFAFSKNTYGLVIYHDLEEDGIRSFYVDNLLGNFSLA